MMGALLTPVSTIVFMLFHTVPSVLLSMVAPITAYVKESDWLMKNYHQSENGWKSNHREHEHSRGYHVKEHKKCVRNRCQKWPRIWFVANYQVNSSDVIILKFSKMTLERDWTLGLICTNTNDLDHWSSSCQAFLVLASSVLVHR